MKRKTYLILLAFLPIPMLIGRHGFFKSDKDYAMTHLINVSPTPFPQSNNRPIVKIISPTDKSSYPSGTRVAYEISVSDQEDGESKYGEIPPNEVLLKLEYLEKSGVPIENDNMIEGDSSAVTGILLSNCLNCHAFNGKLIGPSFYEISKHYKDSSEQGLQTMVGRIKDGASGTWGNMVMPAHPELPSAEIYEMVQWIMKNAGNENIHYYTGTEGSIKLPLSVITEKNASFIITASYTDHGVENGQKLKGKDSVMIYSE